MKLRLALAVDGGASNTSSGFGAARFLGGKAREVLRKLIKEVFPEFLAPTTRMLIKKKNQLPGTTKGKSANLLIRCGVFSSPDSSRICHCANCTAGVAVSSSVGHTLGSGIRVDCLA